MTNKCQRHAELSCPDCEQEKKDNYAPSSEEIEPTIFEMIGFLLFPFVVGLIIKLIKSI